MSEEMINAGAAQTPLPQPAVPVVPSGNAVPNLVPTVENTVQEKSALRQKAREKLAATIAHAEQMQASFQELNDAEEVLTEEFKSIVPGGEISESHAKLKKSLEKNAAYIKELHDMAVILDEVGK